MDHDEVILKRGDELCSDVHIVPLKTIDAFPLPNLEERFTYLVIRFHKLGTNWVYPVRVSTLPHLQLCVVVSK